MEITIQTEQLLTIWTRCSARAWCAECGSEVEMVGANELMRLGVPAQPQVAGAAVAGGWHLSEAADGSRLVCLESLLSSVLTQEVLKNVEKMGATHDSAGNDLHRNSKSFRGRR
jgi:hypothetical protein